MKCNQSRPGFKLVLPYPFPTTMTITPQAPPLDSQRNGYRHWFPKHLMRLSRGDCRFNPACRRVTIQEYLTLCIRLWITESEKPTPVDSIKDLVRIYRRKRSGKNNEDEDISPKTLNGTRKMCEGVKLSIYWSISGFRLLFIDIILSIYPFIYLFLLIYLSIYLCIPIHIYPNLFISIFISVWSKL